MNYPKDQLKIQFIHVPTSKTVYFTAFLETFTDSYDAEWSSDKVFGRMDPIAQYKGTTRKINCSFGVPAHSHFHAYKNHIAISNLLRMMYPKWQGGNMGVYNITAPPLMLVKFNNLIRDVTDNTRGLLGYIPSLKYEPDMNSTMMIFNIETLNTSNVTTEITNENAQLAGEDGFLDYNGARQATKLQEAVLATPVIGWQSYKVSFELNVLHTHKLGHGKDTNTSYEEYPYGFKNILGG